MENKLKLKTSFKPHTTTIQFGENYAFNDISSEKKIALITDQTIEELYADQFSHLNVSVFSFPSGEQEKTRETKSMLEDHLLSHNFGKDTLIIGLGGGVVCDIAGFLAATYCRGVDLIQIPTTLLAMVDASVGSKNGVNTPYGKNMVGTFYPPQEVLIDTHFLKTLSEKQKKNGLVEMLKAGLIASPTLFADLKENAKNWEENALEFIYESVVIKRDIVREDPEEEKGLRRVLNLGHTFGHALEILEGFQIEHGEAVAIGILVSCYISEKMGILEPGIGSEIKNTFDLFSIPLRICKKHTVDEMMQTMARDKKALKASPRIVCLKRIGQVAPFDGDYCTEVDFSLLEEAISWMNETFCEVG